jgi:hypothetical protein
MDISPWSLWLHKIDMQNLSFPIRKPDRNSGRLPGAKHLGEIPDPRAQEGSVSSNKWTASKEMASPQVATEALRARSKQIRPPQPNVCAIPEYSSGERLSA